MHVFAHCRYLDLLVCLLCICRTKPSAFADKWYQRFFWSRAGSSELFQPIFTQPFLQSNCDAWNKPSFYRSNLFSAILTLMANAGENKCPKGIFQESLARLSDPLELRNRVWVQREKRDRKRETGKVYPNDKGGGLSERTKKTNLFPQKVCFKKPYRTILGPPKTCFTFCLEFFGHIYNTSI